MNSKAVRKIIVTLLAAALVILNVCFVLLPLSDSGTLRPLPDSDSSASDALPDSVGSDLSATDFSPSDSADTVLSQSDVSDTDLPDDTTDEDTPVEEEPDLNQYAVITVSSAILREKASSDSKKLGSIKKNTTVIVIGANSSESWYNVTYDGKTGWINESCLELIRNRALDATLYPAIPEPIPGQVQSINGTATDKYMGEIAEDYHAMSVQVAIIENGSVAYTMEYGYANKEDKVVATADTKYRIASLSKVFTTMNVLNGVEDGLLQLDEDVGSISGYKTRNPSYKNTKITMLMLLTHTSSLRDGDPTYKTYPWTQLSEKESYIATRPGTRFSYTNFGMGYAAACLEKRAGMQLSQYAEESFLDSMGIDAAYDGTRLDNRSLVATLYTNNTVSRTVKEICAAPRWSTPGQTYTVGAGGLIISAQDYAALMTILINGGEYNGVQYLSKETVDVMLTGQINAGSFTQCIGVRKMESMIDGRTMYYHPGSAYGMFSMMCFDPTDGSGVVVLTSGASGATNDKKLYSVCAEIIGLCYEDVINA